MSKKLLLFVKDGDLIKYCKNANWIKLLDWPSHKIQYVWHNVYFVCEADSSLAVMQIMWESNRREASVGGWISSTFRAISCQAVQNKPECGKLSHREATSCHVILGEQQRFCAKTHLHKLSMFKFKLLYHKKKTKTEVCFMAETD